MAIRISVLLLLMISLVDYNLLHAQSTPAKINYQAAARDAAGDILMNQNLTVRFSILKSAAGGSLEYQETHSTSTNQFGLFNLKIGEGTNTGGAVSSLDAIDWGSDNYFLKVEIDDGSGYVDMGTTQLLSVPYSLYAKEAGEIDMGLDDLNDVTSSGAATGQVLKFNGIDWTPSNDNGASYTPGTGITITGNTISAQSSTAIWNAGQLQGYGISSTAPAVGDVLQWNGSSWVPAVVSGGSGNWLKNGNYVYNISDSIGIGVSQPVAKLHVASNRDVLFGDPGNFRLMWIAGKAALRAGSSSNSGWDLDSIGSRSVAFGHNTKAIGIYSVAFGAITKASGSQSTALGGFTTASASHSLATGYYTTASGSNATTIGEGTIADGNSSFAAGYYSTAMGDFSVATGFQTHASGIYGIAMGSKDTASGVNSIAFGFESTAIGDYSVANGYRSKAIGKYSKAMGYINISQGDHATALGYRDSAMGKYSFTTGWQSIASGDASTAMGFESVASGIRSTAIGYKSYAIGDYSKALGYQDSAVGESSFTSGRNTVASGYSASAMGNFTIASGDQSTAMGNFTIASTYSSTSMGLHTEASGLTATAMGSNTIASGDLSTAMGRSTQASGDYSTSMGYFTTASGVYSTTMGNSTKASGDYSTAMGSATTAASAYETVLGRYNTLYSPTDTSGWNSNDRLFVIGNGASTIAKSDALVILKNGNTGIGVSNPAYHLDVAGASMRINVGANANFVIAKEGTDPALLPTFYSYGYIGSISFPFYRIYSDNFYAGSSANYQTYSDRRIKENIQPLQSSLAKVLALKGVQYDLTKDHYYKGQTDNPRLTEEERKNQIGFIAQEVEEVFPQFVKEDEGSGLKSVGYMGLIPVLVEAIKEQQEQIEEKQVQLDQQQAQIEMLIQEVQNLKKANN